LAGYIKLNESEAQTDINDPNSMELERIYLKQPYQGKGLGKTLLNYAVNIAAENDKLYIWLGVWEKNTKAIQFYKRNGFYKIDTHPFIMGSEEQTDFIMKKDLQ
jgi:ribosomal protein S18 acetylase RimI-like enzyme